MIQVERSNGRKIMSTRRRRSLGDEIELKEDDAEEEEVRFVVSDHCISSSLCLSLEIEESAF